MRSIGLSIFSFVTTVSTTAAYAGPTEQCYRIHNRLAGIPPTAAELASCVDQVTAGNAEAIALQVVEKPSFFSDTLRSAFTPWSNEDDKVLEDLNDFTATLIGATRDGVDFREVLSQDIIYTCENTQGLPEFALNNNEHYAECGNTADLKTALLRKTQTELNPALVGKTSVPAGVYTTRGFAEAFYDAGTNRLATRVTLKNFLCEDIETFNDTSIADFRIRQDVDRAPGGTPKTYVNECKGCHAGMDPLTGAFAYLDWNADDGIMTYDDTQVIEKFFVNAGTFSQGFRTTSDEWLNYWTAGQNARVGWGIEEGTVITGNGPKSLGQMYAGSEQFATCMASFAYETVCVNGKDLKNETVKELGGFFKESGYQMKPLFARVATSCMGE